MIDTPISKSVQQYLKNSLLKVRLENSLIFYGEKYLGKLETAKYYVRLIMCENDKDLELCNTCSSCLQAIHNNNSFFYLEVEPEKKQITVEQIRNLINFVEKTSLSSTHKLVIIKDVEKLSPNAANALLKTIEENRGNHTIIMTSSFIEEIPLTLCSRSILLRFNQISDNEIYEYLLKRGASREIALEKSKLANGKIGLAQKFFDDSDFYNYYMENILFFLNLLNIKIHERICLSDSILNKQDSNNVQRDSFLEKLSIWQRCLRDLILMDYNIYANKYYKNFKNNFNEIIDQMNTSRLINIYNAMQKAKNLLKNNSSPKLAMELLLIDL